MDRNKYPGYNENDTKWDEHHRSSAQMTNREFFSSNAKGGFYEGMEYDEGLKDWIPDAESRQRTLEKEQKNECSHCGDDKRYCWC